MQREKVKLDPNVPETVTLQYPNGKMLPDRGFGPSVLYTTTDDRALFVDLETSTRICNLGLEPGESFVLMKQVRKGAPAHIEVRLSLATEKMRAAKEHPSEVEQQMLGTMANIVEGKPPAAPRPSPIPPAVARRLDTHPAPLQGTGTHGPVPAPATYRTVSTIPTKATYDAAMTEFLLMAGRATRQVEQVLGAEGGSVRFDSRDVAALATSMFIAADGAGHITWQGVPHVA